MEYIRFNEPKNWSDGSLIHGSAIVRGYCMENANIERDDIIYISEDTEPYNGCIMLIEIYDDLLEEYEPALRRMYFRKKKVYVMADNDEYKSKMYRRDDIRLIGVVKDVIKGEI